MDLQYSRPLSGTEQRIRSSGREQFKAFRDAEIHRLHQFVHEIGMRKTGQTNDIKDMREYGRDGIY